MEDNKEQKIEQPTIDAQQIYLSLISNDAEEVQILRTKKKYKVRWLKNGQLEYQGRRDEKATAIPVAEMADFIIAKIKAER